MQKLSSFYILYITVPCRASRKHVVANFSRLMFIASLEVRKLKSSNSVLFCFTATATIRVFVVSMRVLVLNPANVIAVNKNQTSSFEYS